MQYKQTNKNTYIPTTLLTETTKLNHSIPEFPIKTIPFLSSINNTTLLTLRYKKIPTTSTIQHQKNIHNK